MGKFKSFWSRSKLAAVYLCLILPSGFLHFGAHSVHAEEVWEIAPGRTSIGFNVKHFVLLSVKGLFKDYHGTVKTPSNGDFSHASVDVSIPVSSISTGNTDRDAHLRTDDFFNAGEYPEMVFKSTKVVAKSENDYELHGLLKIRNISKPVSLTVKHVKTKLLSDGTIRSDFVATGSVNRYDFGLKWNELTEAGSMVVDELVNISLEVSLVRTPDSTQKLVTVSQPRSNG